MMKIFSFNKEEKNSINPNLKIAWVFRIHLMTLSFQDLDLEDLVE